LTWRERRPYRSRMLLDRLDVSAADFQAGTGWEIKPEGACKGEVCVPLPGPGFDVVQAAGRLGMELVEEPGRSLWALGPETLGGRALSTTDTADVTLPDLDGNPFAFASLHGRKVVAVMWAPY
jgi:hypothetical protein